MRSQNPNEEWLEQRLKLLTESHVMGSVAYTKRTRKEILEAFLEHAQKNCTAGVECCYGHRALLFFVRVVGSFFVALPAKFELKLHLKVILFFLKWGEACFVEALSESGGVAVILQTLSDEHGVDEDAQFFALYAVSRVAQQGSSWKALLCQGDAVPCVLECVWSAVRTLAELFRGNPNHRVDIVFALLHLLGHTLPVTVRAALLCLSNLLANWRPSPEGREILSDRRQRAEDRHFRRKKISGLSQESLEESDANSEEEEEEEESDTEAYAEEDAKLERDENAVIGPNDCFVRRDVIRGIVEACVGIMLGGDMRASSDAFQLLSKAVVRLQCESLLRGFAKDFLRERREKRAEERRALEFRVLREYLDFEKESVNVRKRRVEDSTKSAQQAMKEEDDAKAAVQRASRRSLTATPAPTDKPARGGLRKGTTLDSKQQKEQETQKSQRALLANLRERRKSRTLNPKDLQKPPDLSEDEDLGDDAVPQSLQMTEGPLHLKSLEIEVAQSPPEERRSIHQRSPQQDERASNSAASLLPSPMLPSPSSSSFLQSPAMPPMALPNSVSLPNNDALQDLTLPLPQNPAANAAAKKSGLGMRECFLGGDPGTETGPEDSSPLSPSKSPSSMSPVRSSSSLWQKAVRKTKLVGTLNRHTYNDKVRKRAAKEDVAGILVDNLLLLLAARSPNLCDELVELGLAETLLACVLDSVRPLRQVEALRALNHLRALSPKAELTVRRVFGFSKRILSAFTVHAFRDVANDEVLEVARFNLRCLHAYKNRPGRVAADELLLQQDLLEEHCRLSAAFDVAEKRTLNEAAEKQVAANDEWVRRLRKIPEKSSIVVKRRLQHGAPTSSRKFREKAKEKDEGGAQNSDQGEGGGEKGAFLTQLTEGDDETWEREEEEQEKGPAAAAAGGEKDKEAGAATEDEGKTEAEKGAAGQTGDPVTAPGTPRAPSRVSQRKGRKATNQPKEGGEIVLPEQAKFKQEQEERRKEVLETLGVRFGSDVISLERCEKEGVRRHNPEFEEGWLPPPELILLRGADDNPLGADPLGPEAPAHSSLYREICGLMGDGQTEIQKGIGFLSYLFQEEANKKPSAGSQTDRPASRETLARRKRNAPLALMDEDPSSPSAGALSARRPCGEKDHEKGEEFRLHRDHLAHLRSLAFSNSLHMKPRVIQYTQRARELPQFQRQATTGLRSLTAGRLREEGACAYTPLRAQTMETADRDSDLDDTGDATTQERERGGNPRDRRGSLVYEQFNQRRASVEVREDLQLETQWRQHMDRDLQLRGGIGMLREDSKADAMSVRESSVAGDLTGRSVGSMSFRGERSNTSASLFGQAKLGLNRPRRRSMMHAGSLPPGLAGRRQSLASVVSASSQAVSQANIHALAGRSRSSANRGASGGSIARPSALAAQLQNARASGLPTPIDLEEVVREHRITKPGHTPDTEGEGRNEDIILTFCQDSLPGNRLPAVSFSESVQGPAGGPHPAAGGKQQQAGGGGFGRSTSEVAEVGGSGKGEGGCLTLPLGSQSGEGLGAQPGETEISPSASGGGSVSVRRLQSEGEISPTKSSLKTRKSAEDARKSVKLDFSEGQAGEREKENEKDASGRASASGAASESRASESSSPSPSAAGSGGGGGGGRSPSSQKSFAETDVRPESLGGGSRKGKEKGSCCPGHGGEDRVVGDLLNTAPFLKAKEYQGVDSQTFRPKRLIHLNMEKPVVHECLIFSVESPEEQQTKAEKQISDSFQRRHELLESLHRRPTPLGMGRGIGTSLHAQGQGQPGWRPVDPPPSARISFQDLSQPSQERRGGQGKEGRSRKHQRNAPSNGRKEVSISISRAIQRLRVVSHDLATDPSHLHGLDPSPGAERGRVAPSTAEVEMLPADAPGSSTWANASVSIPASASRVVGETMTASRRESAPSGLFPREADQSDHPPLSIDALPPPLTDRTDPHLPPRPLPLDPLVLWDAETEASIAAHMPPLRPLPLPSVQEEPQNEALTAAKAHATSNVRVAAVPSEHRSGLCSAGRFVLSYSAAVRAPVLLPPSAQPHASLSSKIRDRGRAGHPRVRMDLHSGTMTDRPGVRQEGHRYFVRGAGTPGDITARQGAQMPAGAYPTAMHEEAHRTGISFSAPSSTLYSVRSHGGQGQGGTAEGWGGTPTQDRFRVVGTHGHSGMGGAGRGGVPLQSVHSACRLRMATSSCTSLGDGQSQTGGVLRGSKARQRLPTKVWTRRGPHPTWRTDAEAKIGMVPAAGYGAELLNFQFPSNAAAQEFLLSQAERLEAEERRQREIQAFTGRGGF
uniref:Uncharacterized protein n=1 Tax=Chromera velia CCMP2878 TaxID=1169474 RepID=A0A0G4FZY4_9ALVE|eukprot:Cvel_19574.t1-p1 / transcript=Cvel_19574.t1 / gene=Cvel_19574 / organism=Chromera_velia_CCMP2878 / gene_product=hypothetical protein / transcript_product=hypothetical protein / location=Cvel_scaffold1698:12812-28044(-) / protein_length=2288 / sequence_SO=supercontig / SO=protein_coding / is_pseudo=false